MRTIFAVVAVCILSAGIFLAGGCAEQACRERAKAMGLKGCWAFDEASGDAVKNTAGPNSGRIIDGLQRTAGKSGKAIAFDGKGYVLIDSSPCLNSPQYTFTACVKLKDTGDYQYIVWRGGPAFPEAREARTLDLWLSQDGCLSALVDCANAAGDRLHLVGKTKVTNDQWHQVAVVVNGKTMAFYVDGQKDAEAALPGPLATSDFPLWIGARPGDVAAKGIIDQVKFFDKALTPEQLAELK